MRVPIATNSVSAIMDLIDNNPLVPLLVGNELCAQGGTPLGGTITAAKDYFEGNLPGFAAPTVGDTALKCRPISVILMTDGAECCGGCSTIISGPPAWLGCPGPAGDSSIGITCSSSCTTVTSCPSDLHFESAPQYAYDMLTKSMVPSSAGKVSKQIRTYAIGLGISAGDPGIEHIAKAGGTSGGFYASNEAALSAAFTQIIADAQPPAELCNNLDDDCDTLVDEGITKYCNKPKGIPDKTLCDEPDETLCDGEDDDCDGFIDEGVLNACMVCGDVPDEICDGEDNDCDGRTDEGTDGGECGGDKGSCKKGTLSCVGGKLECLGQVGGDPEICNCADDDCDGFVDEDIESTLCKDGACVGCECIVRCTPGQEFMPTCAEGRAPDLQDSGECLCVEDNCDKTECRGSTLMRDGEVACAPSDPGVTNCLCKAGKCTARCDGVGCEDGEVCNKHTGRCVEDSCRGLGCEEGSLCDAMTGKCVKDACATANCAANEVCRAGACEKSCADVSCPFRKLCQGGKCVDNPCATISCTGSKICDAADGKCVADACSGVACDKGLACAASSGKCERDPCWTVQCPKDQRCAAGECVGTNPDGSSTTPRISGRGRDLNNRVLATGGGGCTCRIADHGGGTTGRGFLSALLVFGLVLRLRRRRLRAGGALAAAAAGLVLCGLFMGCSVQPFCLDCVDAGKNPSGTGGGSGTGGSTASDSGFNGPDDGSVATKDGGSDLPPGCKKPMPETCDGKDEDCDFKVDEDTTAKTNDCTQSGVCAGTVPVCVAGAFTCRYPDAREADETICDNVDNDCDGRTDETFKALGAACEMGIGECKIVGKQICSPDGVGVRCAVAKTIPPGDEICNGLDDDCDGMIDEPKSDPGPNPSYVKDEVVKIGGLWIGKYEASRSDAASSAQGIISTRACSRAGVLPWTNITYAEAVTACAAADMQLCADADWVSACKGESGTCLWSYTPSGSGTGCLTDAAMYPTNGSACNGHDLMAATGAADTDALAPTGASSKCFVQRSGGDPLFDMSGNAKEWTRLPGTPASMQLRGGSYNNLPGGMQCGFDFAVAAPTVRLANLGFRCCSNTDPN
jgi:hypothetical protein